MKQICEICGRWTASRYTCRGCKRAGCKKCVGRTCVGRACSDECIHRAQQEDEKVRRMIEEWRAKELKKVYVHPDLRG